jgi:type II restriction/modification system DNA methylase subunit YeeA
MDTTVIPDHKLHVVARDDDYFFGVLHSCAHELWTIATCSWIGKGNDPSYNSATTFDTFPFPYPPGTEPTEADSPIVRAIADAARELVRLRDAWLSPPNASEADLKDRTLTKLYNARPEWLANAHRALDHAVFAAYGWLSNLTDQEILSRLLALNHERAANQPSS